MADEITGRLVLNVSKGGAKIARSESFSIDMTGDSFISGVQGIPTTGEILVEADELGTAGYVYIKNLDSTNFVTVGNAAASTNHIIKLKAGECCLFRAFQPVYVDADTAACNVEYIIIED